MARDPRRERRLGLVYGLAAYGSWGIFPIYLKAVRSVPVVEVLAHRVVWALAVLLVVTGVRGELQAVAAALRHRRALLVLSGSTVFIAINWLVYIYSVTHDRILESSLGYYINPLISVLLGIVLLGERLEPLMKAAALVAAAGVVWLAIDLGQLPWISLTVAFSFGLYGLLRKIAPVGALIGLTVETLLLAPFAGAYLVWALTGGRAAFLSGRPGIDVLLVLAGPVTAAPLLCFAAAARRLPLSTMGFLQYVSPTLQFLIAVAVYAEPFDRARAGAFACIWAAVALFAFDSIRRRAPEPVMDA
ncbi:MAG: EamA family transporter RarD [Acidobacteria bacterium]|nr:MAG: EamA family transporter RarD [Acidobacteriota bacterium]